MTSKNAEWPRMVLQRLRSDSQGLANGTKITHKGKLQTMGLGNAAGVEL